MIAATIASTVVMLISRERAGRGRPDNVAPRRRCDESATDWHASGRILTRKGPSG
jgi:hypothetical protein